MTRSACPFSAPVRSHRFELRIRCMADLQVSLHRIGLGHPFQVIEHRPERDFQLIARCRASDLRSQVAPPSLAPVNLWCWFAANPDIGFASRERSLMFSLFLPLIDG